MFLTEQIITAMESNCLFARKFDETVDNDIIEKIYAAVHKE